MAHYLFETNWSLTASMEEVFDVLAQPGDFSDWWPWVKKSVLLEEGDSNGVGRRALYAIRSPLIYGLTFEVRSLEVERPKHLHTLVRGDLIGTGTYLLTAHDGITDVRFNWYVSTTRAWMNAAALVARPLLAWAHHRVMRDGCEAMASHLGARLISFDTRLVSRPTPVATAGRDEGSVSLGSTAATRNDLRTTTEEDRDS
jgi:Polyketide cyclase / dehydrase and lipid transport